jgi:hypothetical protein
VENLNLGPPYVLAPLMILRGVDAQLDALSVCVDVQIPRWDRHHQKSF